MKTKTANPTPAQNPVLADVIEFVGDPTSVGKTTLALRSCHLLREAGRHVTLVRIESARRRNDAKWVADRQIFIETEVFADAANRNAGVVGVLEPVFEAILGINKVKDAVIIDWAGGLSTHRLEVLAATGFDNVLGAMQLRAISAVVTTNSVEHLRQAESYLHRLKTIAPEMQHSIVLSCKSGSFTFPKGSEQGAAFSNLMREVGDAPFVRIPLAAGRALSIVNDAGIDPALAMIEPVQDLARRLKTHVFAASALQSELALWWNDTEHELRKIIGGHDASDIA